MGTKSEREQKMERGENWNGKWNRNGKWNGAKIGTENGTVRERKNYSILKNVKFRKKCGLLLCECDIEKLKMFSKD